MLKMNWFFKLIFLGTTWSAIHAEEDTSSESLPIPKLDEIESFFKSSYENNSYRELFDDGRLRLKDAKENPLEDLSYRHHGSHPANAKSWKLQCVWNALNSVARRKSKMDTTSTKSKSLPEVRQSCNHQVWKDCGVDLHETCDSNAEYRTIDGTCNNLVNTRWGAAPQPFERFIHSDYGNRVNSFRLSYAAEPLPNARKISRALSNSNKAAEPKVTLMLMQWGQFLDHDITLTPERELDKELTAKYTEYDKIWSYGQCSYVHFHRSKILIGCIIKCDDTPGCTTFAYYPDVGCYLADCKVPVPTPIWRLPPFKGYSINTDPVEGSSTMECCDRGIYNNSVSLGEDCVPIDVTDDPFYRQDNRTCLRFVRSMPTSRCETVRSPMEQINQNTAFVDGSMVYGSDAEVANFVRNGSQGLLNTTRSVGNGKTLPPKGGDGTAHQCPIESEETCFLAGDIRVDEVPGLSAMHTIFIRLHNTIATDLCKLNPSWCGNDELLFQETRRIVIALIQQITYGDWLPLVVGQNLMDEYKLSLVKHGYRDTYNPTVNPTIRNVFATAAFRFGHSLISEVIKTASVDNNLPFPGNFFNNTLLEDSGTSPLSLLKGMSRCPSAPIDAIVERAFTNSLYADKLSNDGNFFGLDLLSINIQRGRDHGIPGYTEWRKFCGLEHVTKFSQLNKYMSSDLVKSFEHIYQNVRDIDLFPAGLAEHPIADGILGPTFSCLIARQFSHIKHGDRFWYERKDQPKPFTPEQLSSIRTQNLVSILCKVNEHAPFRFQPNLFSVENEVTNPVADCSSYSFINLQPWDENQKDGVHISGQYLTFSTEKVSWDLANERCESKNAKLAVLNNPQAFHAYVSSKYGGERFWLGGSDRNTEGTWTWNNGRTFVNFPWGSEEPNDSGGNEDCLEWGWNINYNDETCTAAQRYVCVHGCLGGAYIGGKCLTFSEDELPWNDAKESCSRQNGRLAILNDPQAFKSYVHREYPGDEKFWLGLSDIENEGTWVWVNGQPLEDNFPWHSGEPNAAFPDEDCLVLWGDALSDAPCPRHYRYVCEKGCPNDAFSISTSSQCFKLIEGQKWSDAASSCENEGLAFAQPQDDIAVELRKYLLDNYDQQYFWVSGRGDGEKQAWMRDDTAVLPTLLYPGADREGQRDRCLSIISFEASENYAPDRPYSTYFCNDIRRVLCQGDGDCVHPWFSIGSQCFYLEGPKEEYNSMDWDSARSFCRGKATGGDLAQPKDITALAAHLWPLHHTFYWLGAMNSRQWLDGTPIAASGWRENHPENANDCVAIHPVYEDKSLHSKPCGTTQYMKFVCEKPLN